MGEYIRDDSAKQVICDDCGKVSLFGLTYRNDLETPRRLCSTCCDKHDNHPVVAAERFHLSALESDHDDF